jgi:hypothetical protein
MSQAYLAIDPGKSGGMAYLSCEGALDLRKYTTEVELLDYAEGIDRNTIVIVEDVPVFVSSATSNASSFKLGYNYGFHVGVFRAYRMVVNLIKPKTWQMGLSGLKPKMGYTERKRVLRDIASRLYPEKKVTHATADALLILDYWLKKNT